MCKESFVPRNSQLPAVEHNILRSNHTVGDPGGHLMLLSNGPHSNLGTQACRSNSGSKPLYGPPPVFSAVSLHGVL